MESFRHWSAQPNGNGINWTGHIVVTQMAEFTEIIDTDQDGKADRYNNLASDFVLVELP